MDDIITHDMALEFLNKAEVKPEDPKVEGAVQDTQFSDAPAGN